MNTGSMTTACGEHTATLLPNGDVLVAGGLSNGKSQASCTAAAELHNRSTGQWTTTGSMTIPRVDPTATLLGNGKVLVAGSICIGGSSYPDNSAELYDPSTGKWQATGSMTFARRSGAGAALLQNGQVLVAGENGTSAELYDPLIGSHRTSTGVRVASAADMSFRSPSEEVATSITQSRQLAGR